MLTPHNSATRLSPDMSGLPDRERDRAQGEAFEKQLKDGDQWDEDVKQWITAETRKVRARMMALRRSEIKACCTSS
jgi:hypothetical protein